MTLFERIAAGEIPAKIVRNDDDVLAIHDINPQAPVHILVIPRRPLARVGEATDNDATLLGKLLLAARDLAKAHGLEETGYRLVINNGPHAGESV
ncbi:MAG: histidine triad nucleotide-binding protein, partial [Chthoniobacterales bacterium]